MSEIASIDKSTHGAAFKSRFASTLQVPNGMLLCYVLVCACCLLFPDKADVLLQVVLDTLEYGSKIKKTPVVVGNCTGRFEGHVGADSILPEATSVLIGAAASSASS